MLVAQSKVIGTSPSLAQQDWPATVTQAGLTGTTL